MNRTYLIGNAHLDPVWLWRWQEGFSEILATFRSALDRMKDFPDFRFTSACAVYYEWIEKTDPEMFAEIQERVREGRWNIVGGWFLQPDCNIPCGESFARHALISQRYFKEKFGVTAKTGYNVDSFGHNASLPMILRESGMENYVFMRPMPHENGGLHDLFEWESADGSSVRTYRIPHFYNITQGTLGELDDIIARSEKQPLMAFYGVGNHGGGPTVSLINEINGHHRPEGVVYSTPDEYFDDTKALELPVVKGELQHHARGCYSANSFIKRSNRAAEYALLAAEKLCILSDSLTGEDNYPAEKLRKAWKNLLFNQFHDILGGCSIRSAYTDAGYLFGEIMSIAEQESFAALTRVCRQIDTLHGETLPSAKTSWRLWSCGKLGSPVIVFNPHAWETEVTVELTAVAARVTDDEGNAMPIQTVRAEHTNGGDRYGTAFRAKLPALGYRVFRIFTDGEAPEFPEITADANARTLENELVRITFDGESGEISEFISKATGEKLISRPTGTALLDETACDTWAHDKVTLGESVGSFGGAKFEVIERGCVRSTLRVESYFGGSTLRRDYTLERGSDAVKVSMTVDFHEKHRTFKLVLPAGDSVTASIPYGSIERPLGTGEEPCAEWLASGKLGYVSDITYGYDTDGDNFRPTIFRSAIYADHFGQRDSFCEYMEQGIGKFSYALFGFTTASDAKRRADELNCPPRVVNDTFHDGKLGGEYCGYDCGCKNIVVTAVKRGEEGGDVIRVAELDGTPVVTELRLLDKELSVEVKPHGIATLKDGVRTDLIENSKT